MPQLQADWLSVLKGEIEADFKLAYETLNAGGIPYFSWKDKLWLRLQTLFGFAHYFIFTNEESINDQTIRKVTLRGYKTRDGRIYITQVDGVV